MHAQETNLSPVVGRNRERRLVKLNRSPIVGESERIANSEIMHAQVLGPFETVCAKPSSSPTYSEIIHARIWWFFACKLWPKLMLFASQCHVWAKQTTFANAFANSFSRFVRKLSIDDPLPRDLIDFFVSWVYFEREEKRKISRNLSSKNSLEIFYLSIKKWNFLSLFLAFCQMEKCNNSMLACNSTSNYGPSL